MSADSLLVIPEDYFRPLGRREVFPVPAADSDADDLYRPLEVDLGCGDGGFLHGMADHFPDRDFLGVERLKGRALKVCRKASRLGLTNLRVLRLESTYTIGYLLPEGEISRVHLLFPDPWPKKKHHKRRLVSQEFCEGLVRVLEPGGEFLFKTDHPAYFEESMIAIRNSGLLDEIDWREDEFFYAQTDFEKQWRAEGKPIFRARFSVAARSTPH